MELGDWDDRAMGYFVSELPDGRLIHILPMIFNHRLAVQCLLPGTQEINVAAGILDAWCYDDYPQALVAAINWDPMTEQEPKGWKKHPFSGRRYGEDDRQRQEREELEVREPGAHRSF